MHYGSNNKKAPFFIDGNKLVDSEYERGVYLYTNLKWKNHILICTNRANQMLGRIRRSFAHFDSKLLKSLYPTFIRPFLEFAVPVWSPNLKKDCEAIERIQQKATKLVSAIRNRSYEERLRVLDLTTLVDRRKRGDLIQLYKFIHNIDKMKINDSFQPVRNNLRGHCFKYFKEIAQHPQRENFFFNRIANTWNALPSEIVTATTVNSFKAALDCWMSSNQAHQLS